MLWFVLGFGLAALALTIVLWRRRPRLRCGRLALVLRFGDGADQAAGASTADLAPLMAQSRSYLARSMGAVRVVASRDARELCLIFDHADPDKLHQRAARLQAGRQPKPGPAPKIEIAILRDLLAATPDDQLINHARGLFATAADCTTTNVLVAAYTLAKPPYLGAKMPPAPIVADWLALWFVPQHCTETGVVIGVEIEPRLRHPVYGMLAPNSFHQLIDAEALAHLTCRAVSEALTALRHWDQNAFGLDFMTLRLDPRLLMRPDLADLLLWELDRQDVPPLRLVISVPEEVTLDGAPVIALANIERLAAAGCQIEVISAAKDDAGPAFGRPRVTASRMRIGEDIITGCDRSVRQQVMILAVLALADRLGLVTVAEDVGSAHEHAYLAQIGIAQVQGPGVARAVPQDLMIGYLEECQHQTPPPVSLLRA